MILALIMGVTLAAPHVVTPYPLALEFLAVLLTITVLSFPYAFRSPDPLEAVALGLIVVGALLNILNESNRVPVVVGVAALAVARILHHVKLSRRATRISLTRKQLKRSC